LFARRFDIRRYHFQERKMTNITKYNKMYNKKKTNKVFQKTRFSSFYSIFLNKNLFFLNA
jgi:hypothetical protein